MAMLNNQMVLNMFILFGQYGNLWKEVHLTFIYICHHVLYVTIKQSECSICFTQFTIYIYIYTYISSKVVCYFSSSGNREKLRQPRVLDQGDGSAAEAPQVRPHSSAVEGCPSAWWLSPTWTYLPLWLIYCEY